MNDKVSHRRVRTQPLTTVLIRASSAELITDIERLAEVAGVDTAVISPVLKPRPQSLLSPKSPGRHVPSVRTSMSCSNPSSQDSTSASIRATSPQTSLSSSLRQVLPSEDTSSESSEPTVGPVQRSLR